MAENEQNKEDLLKLIFEHNMQIKTMEEQIEKLLKEKEALQMTTMLVTTIPITGAEPSSSSIGDETSLAAENVKLS